MNTPPSVRTQPQKVSPSDKPLPSPPRDQNFDPDEFDQPKTLIDASDKPLRRRSPPGVAVHEEDWPVLFPKRPTSPGTLQEMLRDTGSQLTQQAKSDQKERYPILGNTLRQVPDEEQLPVSRYSVTHKISRKQISSPDLDNLAGANMGTAAENIHIDNPFKDGVHDSKTVLATKSSRTTFDTPSSLSAGAAAVEKLAQDARPTIEPRQTRTSSLRARLSAGQLVRDSQNKVVGFTDFTATPEPALSSTKRDGLLARKEARVDQSTSPPAKPVSHPLRPKPSKESISGNRAPAQFVAGSRRPTHPRRPSSHGSLRKEFREPTPPLPNASSSRPVPSRPAPKIPRSEGFKHGRPSEKAPFELPASKNSIPVPRQPISNMPRPLTGKAGFTDPKGVEASEVKKEARDEFATLERPSSFDTVKNIDQILSDSEINDAHTTRQSSQALVNHYGAHILEAIEESPQRAYKLKRLSSASPEFGPTLKISPSAERIIMGPDIDREKNPLCKKKSKELDHAMMKIDHNDRPSSSQGLSRSESRFGLINTKIREKKVKSADLDKLSPAIENLLNGSHKLTAQPNHESTDASARGSSISTSFNDPFFDASSQLQVSPEKGNDIEGQEVNVTGEESWIRPLGESAAGSSYNVLITDEILPNDSQIMKGAQSDCKLSGGGSSPFEDTTVVAKDLTEEPSDGLLTNDSQIKNGFQIDYMLSDEANPFEDTSNAAKDVTKDPEDNSDSTPVIHLPSTPEQQPPKNTSNSGSHPPRSSSRMTHPDFTIAKNSPVSPLSADNRPSTPLKDTPQDFARRQNNLGSLRGHGTSQLDLSNHASKRDSTARESNKSQASVSKGSLSIFRGLFHKRSSEHEPFISAKKTKSKTTTTNGSSGSPFPPISEVHPIHRPTLASLARSAANTPRPTTTARPTTPATPSLASPLAAETSTSTHLAMELLDLSRKERSSPKKENLLQLGSILVEGITQARNAEKAMEEAKQAARRAEVAHALCKKSLKEVTMCVEAWRDGL